MNRLAGEEPVRRGPGRPRKQHPDYASALTPVDTGLRATDRRGAARVIGRSTSTVKRLEKYDPDWPKPFAIGRYACNYLLRDIEAYLLKKAGAAQQPERGGTRPKQSRPATAKPTTETA